MAESDVLIPAPWADLLRGGGAARVGAEDVRDADLEGWAAATDRIMVVLDTQDCSTERELLAGFAEVFGLDEDDEHEWDRIDECLADFDVSPASGLVVLWSGWDGLDDDPEHVIPVAVDALVTAAQAWADEGRPWAILIVGDGAAWDLPWAGVGPAPWEADAGAVDDDPADEDEWIDDEISDESLGYGDEPEAADQLSSW